MGLRKVKSLDEVIGTAVDYRPHCTELPSQLIDAAYLTNSTILPVSRMRVGDHAYQVRMFRNRIGRYATLLKVSLLEVRFRNVHGNTSSNYADVTVFFELPVKQDADFVRKAADLLRAEYGHSKSAAHKELPEAVPLVEMIATRIEYYRRGGKISRLGNQMN